MFPPVSPDKHWGPPSLVVREYRRILPGKKTELFRPSIAEVKNESEVLIPFIALVP